MTLDPLVLARLDRTKPLRIYDQRSEREMTCALCGGPIGHGDWKVSLPRRAGQAHVHCADDAGFTVR